MNNNLDTFFTGHISSLQEVEENEESHEFGKPKHKSKNDNSQNNSSIPYHEQVLTSLFGKEVADSFLHPVIESSGGLTGVTASIRAGKKIKSMSKKRLNLTYEQTLSKLSSNAERLWVMLRESSNYSIELETNKIGSDLKSSFEAFARSCLGSSTDSPHLNFPNNNELTEMTVLMNRGRVERANLTRRKKQVMYMLSRVQQDNQAMLMRDKSFLGSADIQASFKELLLPPIIHCEVEKQQNSEEKEKLVDESVSESEKPDRVDRSQARLVFFSEADSQKILKEKCEFGKQINRKLGIHKNVLEDKSKEKSLRPNNDSNKRKDATSVKYLTTPLNSLKTFISDVSYETSTEKKDKAKVDTEWKPLTLGALMDFKMTKKPTFIDEDELHFRQGSVRLWRQKLAQA